VSAHCLQRVRLQRRDLGPVEDDLAGGRLVEPKQRASERRLSAPTLTDQAERFAVISGVFEVSLMP